MTENRPETNEDLANLSQVEQEKCYHVMYAFWHVFHPDYPENHPLREAWWAEVENLRKILTKIPAGRRQWIERMIERQAATP